MADDAASASADSAASGGQRPDGESHFEPPAKRARLGSVPTATDALAGAPASVAGGDDNSGSRPSVLGAGATADGRTSAAEPASAAGMLSTASAAAASAAAPASAAAGSAEVAGVGLKRRRNSAGARGANAVEAATAPATSGASEDGGSADGGATANGGSDSEDRLDSPTIALLTPVEAHLEAEKRTEKRVSGPWSAAEDALLMQYINKVRTAGASEARG
jgi:hypothetical protein